MLAMMHPAIWGQIKPLGLLLVDPRVNPEQPKLGVCLGSVQGWQKSFNYLLESILSQPRANPKQPQATPSLGFAQGLLGVCSGLPGVGWWFNLMFFCYRIWGVIIYISSYSLFGLSFFLWIVAFNSSVHCICWLHAMVDRLQYLFVNIVWPSRTWNVGLSYFILYCYLPLCLFNVHYFSLLWIFCWNY